MLEARNRDLLVPPPVPLRWESSTQRSIASTLASSALGLLRHGANPTAYQDVLAAEYERIGQPRIVITSDAGGGKSAFVLMLTLGLLRKLNSSNRGTTDSRIPILASIASWDPGRDSLYEWLARWIKSTYRSLDSPEYGGTAVHMGL